MGMGGKDVLGFADVLALEIGKKVFFTLGRARIHNGGFPIAGEQNGISLAYIDEMHRQFSIGGLGCGGRQKLHPSVKNPGGHKAGQTPHGAAKFAFD